MSKIVNRIGEENYNSFGSKMIITRYNGAKDLDIYFPEYNWVFEHAQYELHSHFLSSLLSKLLPHQLSQPTTLLYLS